MMNDIEMKLMLGTGIVVGAETVGFLWLLYELAKIDTPHKSFKETFLKH